MIKLNYPLISIVIPTLNSERTLEKTLLSIKKQDYPQDKIEVFIIDGGSTDRTKAISKKYNCKIIDKPNTEVIYRKSLGFIRALGKYVVFIDSDESFENLQSLRLKHSIFLKDHLIKSIISEGCKSSIQSSFINDYINEFGDPFSFYLYREAKSSKHLLKTWQKKYKVLKKHRDYILFDFVHSKYNSLIELWAGGSMIDIEYVRSAFPTTKQNPSSIALLFYLLRDKDKLLAITKHDAIIHDSSSSISEYLRKISSRIKNNVFKTKMGESGYYGREKFQNRLTNLKKFFFPFYAFSLILPFVDSIYLSVSLRKLSYLIHLPLTLYTAILIVYCMLLKLMGIWPKKLIYGN